MIINDEEALSKFIEESVKKTTAICHFQRIENEVEPGVLDLNYCIDGHEGWSELKMLRIDKHGTVKAKIRPSQLVWYHRRYKANGNVKVVGATYPKKNMSQKLYIFSNYKTVAQLFDKGIPYEDILMNVSNISVKILDPDWPNFCEDLALILTSR